MKAPLLLFLALLFSVIQAAAQDDSPYARFGYEGRVLRTPQERQQRSMLLVPNTDTTSAVAKVGLDPANQRYYLFDKQNQVLATDTLAATTIARFLSVDPLAPKYPWYTPYQFAGNTPIWATDLDGLEPNYGGQAYSGYDLFDVNRNGNVSKGERQGGNQALALYGLAALDAYVFRGWLTKSYLAYTLGNAIEDGERSLQARETGNSRAAEAYSNQSKEAYTQFAIGAGLIGATGLVTRGARLVLSNAKPSFLTLDEFSNLPTEGYIDPRKLRFSQNSISDSFKDGGSVDDIANNLRAGTADPQLFPPVRIVEKDGGIYTLDNRRVKAFQEAGVPIKYQKLEQVPKREEFKFTTENNGEAIQVRSKK